MNKILNHLDTDALNREFVSAVPFHHVIIDNFLEEGLANRLRESFPAPGQKEWWKYDNPLEKKLAFNNLKELPECFTEFFSYINGDSFIKILEKISGVEGIVSDAGLNGGGLHLIPTGGKLDVHQDFNIHKGLGMLRKLNLICYLNDPWEEEWGGHLEIWDKDMEILHKRVSPVFNRAVIFRTDMDSNHGHPHPLKCPDDVCRISLATYYYTRHPNIESVPYKSTSYKKLPGDDDGLDELREQRKLGRLENMTTKK